MKHDLVCAKVEKLLSYVAAEPGLIALIDWKIVADVLLREKTEQLKEWGLAEYTKLPDFPSFKRTIEGGYGA